jgi:hypothetical protein
MESDHAPDSLFDRVFCGEPVSTSPENAPIQKRNISPAARRRRNTSMAFAPQLRTMVYRWAIGPRLQEDINRAAASHDQTLVVRVFPGAD